MMQGNTWAEAHGGGTGEHPGAAMLVLLVAAVAMGVAAVWHCLNSWISLPLW